MTRAQLRQFLRSKVRDLSPTNPIFSDSDLNVVLSNAARILQNWVNAVDPNPYTATLVGDITASVDIYALPGDYRSPGIRTLELLIDGSYVEIGRQEFSEFTIAVRRNPDFATVSTSAKKYAIGGGILKLKYMPTVSVTAGMRMIYSASVTFGDDDTTVIALPLELHDCIYLLGAFLIVQDADDKDAQEFYKMARVIFDEWAKGFKTTIGLDGEQINHVGGHIRT